MLEEVLLYINNWFVVSKHNANYTILNGEINLPFMTEGQYFRIVGSKFNDGLHCYEDEEDELTDESFEGSIWELAIPKAVIKITAEIEAFEAKYEASPYASESFGGYSYQKNVNQKGCAHSWKDVFSNRLNTWRKI